MGRTLALRKCGEHEDCQLQSLNGGEWQHTPAKRSVAARLNLSDQEQERLAAQLRAQLGTTTTLTSTLREKIALADVLLDDLDPKTRERLEAELADEVGKVSDLRTRMGEQLARSEARLAHLDEGTRHLPVVQRLHEEAQRLGEVLNGEQSELEAKAHRLGRDLERFDRFTTKLEDAVRASNEASERATRDAAVAAETATHLGERLPKIDGTLSKQDELLRKLTRVEALYTALNNLAAKQAADVEALRSDLHALDHALTHERDERIEGAAKTQRQFGEVMKHVRPS